MQPEPFAPHPLIRGGHLQTIIGYYLSGPKSLNATQLHEVVVSDGDRIVLCENCGSGESVNRAVVVLMHGLGGQAGSPYMLRIAEMFLTRGWITFRMNHRGSGEGQGKARNLYHSGRSDDVSRTLLYIAHLYPDVPLIAVGFSLSGNALLKLIGEQKEAIPANLKGAISVTPPIELSRCATALSRGINRIYDIRFLLMLKEAVESRRQTYADFPGFELSWRTTLREFDDLVTAPMNGFESAEDYYTRCSAKQFLDKITLPTVMIASSDDPFIPVETYKSLPDNDHIVVDITESGGHMGFISATKTPFGNHRWMDYAILTYAKVLLKSEKTTQNYEKKAIKRV